MPRMTIILFAAVVVSTIACGAGGNSARNHGGETTARTETEELPEHGSISKGKYATEEFEPAFSIRIEERGWQVLPPEARDSLAIATTSSLVIFLNVPRVFDPNELRQGTQKPAPEELVAWIEHHHWLDVSRPKPTSVGGVKGQRIDVTAARLPKDHSQFCSGPCVPLFALGNTNNFWIGLDEKVRFVILEDVKGETVTIAIDTTPKQFEKFLPKAQRILDSVEWKVEP